MNTENTDNLENIENEINATEETQTTELTVEEQLNEDLAKEKDKFLRLFAEFENYKRRTSREKLEMLTTASEGVLVALLPVLDDFDRALAQVEQSEVKEYLTGFNLISNKFNDILSSKGMELVKIEKGDLFNADIAEAITQIPAGDDFKGKVVDVIEKGYKLGDKIIRFPKVVIGQ
ncbi:nucleotide exchange factor GrpE [Flavobacterium sp. I3-2]|uniref:nucleotide exchange factor GrpE n=1 Tax=Flavobacterium sp. I3-2 TaxID=2748319 RepID=UPI0015AC60FA|nr:nucleotide exchange factor GrpE [Flavobacterium sp. I3-2]